VIDLQTQALVHVADRAPGVPVSQVVPTLAGERHATVERGGHTHLARLVTYLPGTTFDPDVRLPDHAYVEIGSLLGRISVALADFDHPIAGHFMPWNVGNGLIVDGALRADVGEAAARALAAVEDRLAALHDTLGRLPQQMIHNDGHAGNLLRADAESELVTGVIDFGDVVHTATIADVAVAAESFAVPHPDPFAISAALAVGYDRHRPLADAEIAALPEVVLGRLALTVLLVEYQLRHSDHLASHAHATRHHVVDRLERWSRLDVDAMIDHVHLALEASR
jgi:Ser/Thr protein kinase RdoA (MazF antagonist)